MPRPIIIGKPGRRSAE